MEKKTELKSGMVLMWDGKEAVWKSITPLKYERKEKLQKIEKNQKRKN